MGSADQGFLGHFSLAVVPGETCEPLGLLAVQPWTRRGKSVSKLQKEGRLTNSEARKAPGRESERWGKGVSAAEEVVGQRAALIHVMDSEADDYALLTQLVAQGRRFVIRMARDRAIQEAERKVRVAGESAAMIATRRVALSRRKPPINRNDRRRLGREERVATLSVAARQLSLNRPSYSGRASPKSLQVNVIYVTEVAPPKNAESVEWVLFTTEPIKTKKQILRVVDFYRARWLIEEYFKALKTGCDFQKRQLESCSTLLVALGVFAPIAWGLLRLRALSRTAPDAPATRALTPTQLELLRRHPKSKMPATARVRDALLAVARLGGHLRSNGDPGWIVLGRGYHQLLLLEVGCRVGRETCDQS